MESSFAAHGPPEEVGWTMAAPMLFETTIEERGLCCEGCVSYTIGRSRTMVVVAWTLAYSDKEVRYNVVALPDGPCDEALFKRVMHGAEQANREIVRLEDGVLVMARLRVLACARATIIVDVANNENPLGSACLVKAGRALEESCSLLLEQSAAKVACSVGATNFSQKALLFRGQTMLDTGRCIIKPTSTVQPQRATPSLFAKTHTSLRGVGGCIAYDIGGCCCRTADEDPSLLIAFNVPMSSKFGENRFNVAIVPHHAELDWAVFRRMLEESAPALAGELVLRDERLGMTVRSRMTDGLHALLLVDFAAD